MKTLFSLFAILLSTCLLSQQQLTPNEYSSNLPGHILVIRADSGLKFTVTLEGTRMMRGAVSGVRLVEIACNVCDVQIDFEDESIPPIVIDGMRLAETQDKRVGIWFVNTYRIVSLSDGMADLILTGKSPRQQRFFPFTNEKHKEERIAERNNNRSQTNRATKSGKVSSPPKHRQPIQRIR